MLLKDLLNRIHASLLMALGEMHKYRDGILAKENDLTVVGKSIFCTNGMLYDK